jgi:hypothetical protein
MVGAVEWSPSGGPLKYRLLTVACSALLPVLAPARAGVDNLALLGHNEVNRNHLMDVEISGNRAFVCNGLGSGLELYDISDPGNPNRTWTGGPDCWRARAYGDSVLFMFCRLDGTVRVGITGTPASRGNYNPPGNREALEGGALVGDTLYAAAHQNGIYFIDCSSPTTVTKVGAISLAPTAAAWNVEARDSFLFVANGRHGLAVIGLAGAPRRIVDLALPGLANDIVLDGAVAAISLGAGGFATVDVSDPYAPVLLDVAETGGSCWGLGITGHLVVSGSWRVLELFDISDPANIRLAGWDNSQTWAHGADIRADSLVAIADWRGMSCYRVGPDPGPDIDVCPECVDFGAVSSAVETTVTVRNTGASALVVGSVTTPGGIDVDPASFTISAGDSLSVEVSAAGTGRVSSNIVFNCNDPFYPQYRVEVHKNNSAFPQYGSLAPDFTLLGSDGRSHTLSDYRGRVVYLMFGASW